MNDMREATTGRTDRRRLWLLWAVVGGLLLGAVDFAWIKLLPPPWGGLGNSVATWAVAAFLLGRWLRADWLRGALAGVVMLVLACEAYYFTAFLWQHDDLANMWGSATVIWMGLGVLAGSLFGAAGALSRVPSRVQPVAVAMPAAVLLAEAGLDLSRNGPEVDAAFRSSLVAMAALLAVLAIVLTVLLAGRAEGRRRAAVAVVLLGLLGFGAMKVSGLGG